MIIKLISFNYAIRGHLLMWYSLTAQHSASIFLENIYQLL